ncbi:hypothetical protein BKA81DRAFT_380873 [Phyllosticta paracitricarpa]
MGRSPLDKSSGFSSTNRCSLPACLPNSTCQHTGFGIQQPPRHPPSPLEPNQRDCWLTADESTAVDGNGHWIKPRLDRLRMNKMPTPLQALALHACQCAAAAAALRRTTTVQHQRRHAVPHTPNLTRRMAAGSPAEAADEAKQDAEVPDARHLPLNACTHDRQMYT